MPRRLALTLLVAACGSCMQTRETVERMVMVRTTGSDLQPAATGYIYKKKNDGEESVVKMGESEVMEHLSKLYDRPKHYTASAAAARGPYGSHEASKADTSGEERVIPVKENQEEHVDGIADVDYKKIFDDYSAKYGHSDSYADYLKGLKHYKDGIDHKYEDDSNEHDKGNNNNHHYGEKDDGTYHNAKFESFSISGGYKGHDDDDGHKKHYGHGHGAEDDARGFHKIYDNHNKNDHEYYSKGDDADAHKHYGADSVHERDGPYTSEHHDGKHRHTGKHHNTSAKEGDQPSHEQDNDASHEKHGDGSPLGWQAGNKGFGYKIKH